MTTEIGHRDAILLLTPHIASQRVEPTSQEEVGNDISSPVEDELGDLAGQHRSEAELTRLAVMLLSRH